MGDLQPRRWLYFNYSYQIVQAALTGQGVVLARLALVAESLASGDLVEPLAGRRVQSSDAYWLVLGPRAEQRPQVKAFSQWLVAQAKATREIVGEADDARDPAHAPLSWIGQTTPLSLRIASSGTSCGSGSKSYRNPWVNPSPTV